MAKNRSSCPIAYALDIFGDRWSLLVVRDLLFEGKRRYGDFLNSDEHVATNILADRLANLEKRELISKTSDPTDGRRSYYRLTAKGIELAPVLIEIIVWSAKQEPALPVPKEFLHRAETDREAFLDEIRHSTEI